MRMAMADFGTPIFSILNHGASLGLKWTHAQLREDLEARGKTGAWAELQRKVRQIIVRSVNATRRRRRRTVRAPRGG